MKDILTIIKKTFAAWSEDRAMAWAAAVAYYTLFSIAPLLLIAISVAGLVFGEQAAQGEISEQLNSLIGEKGAQAVQEMLASANKPRAGIIGTIVGFLVLLWGASTVFRYLRMALDVMWEVEPKPGGGVKAIFKTGIISMGMVLTIGFILLIALAVSALLSAFWDAVGSRLPALQTALPFIDFAFSILVITILFAAMFKILPHAILRWRHVWLGALLTAILFAIGKMAIGYYIGQSNITSSYGSIGSVIVLLIWVNYSAWIFFLGAEFTQVYMEHKGQEIRPRSDAIRVKKKLITEDTSEENGPK